ncbi:MAG: branched-chain amino acid ABC transporter permease [Desulfatiglandaceae bacterium]
MIVHKGVSITTLLILALIVFLFFLPQLAGKYVMYMTMHILIFSVFALGFNLLLGYTGLLSFGQAGFYACGAYGCAKVLLVMPSLLPGIICGILSAGVVALILGFLCIRHTRIYFAMLTLCFGMMIYSLAWKWHTMTGGDDGLVAIPRAPLEIPGIFSIDMSAMGNYYYFVLIVCLLAIGLLYRIVNSPFGLTLQGIRDSESRIAFAGISVRNYRLIAFTIAGLYAGLAGALIPPLENTVTPPLAHWTHSAEPIMATLLGGIHTFSGPIVGAFLFYVIKDIIVRFTEYWLIWLGAIVLALVMGLPGGVVSIFEKRLIPWIRLRFAERSHQ